ncbi:proteasome 26S subunit [Salpingoeca rosetta]|uniref:Proteasome 26S subunit n=1 Tax=Salpingoeca rosetta (strain ATCC 50818 / BSB-021) TaxID=946362 RepID=F2U624_SALR5|nr:proteasome 26S subunit [Salpingoeca rosetta]EGD82965.1 proteasome 26S subunit [Salpingoeca rosetta]|eukprot:XP_004995329.1 proteasome 26S subunit [Salpingoeca rosetta]
MPGLTSVGGVLALLDEPETELKVFAINKLLALVDNFWPEIANVINKIEELFEDKAFPERTQAALLASQVYYHLGELDDALHFALLAENAFNVEDTSLFVTTITGWAMDTYVAKRQATPPADIDPALETMANRMLNRCLIDKQFQQAIGLALEARRLDIVEQALDQCDNKTEMLAYTYDVAMRHIPIRTFRDDVLALLADAYKKHAGQDVVNHLQCLVAVENTAAITALLTQLIADDKLMAYQLTFHLEQMASQHLQQQIMAAIDAATQQEGNDNAPIPAAEAKRLKEILSGEISRPLFVEFMGRNNKTDTLILEKTKKSIQGLSSVLDNGLVLSHSVMSAGTTSDKFLRENQQFLGRFTNWAKLTTVASLGVIHKDHTSAAKKVLQPYLPSENSTNEYENGGGLYALGLIYANNGASQVDYLVEQLKTASTEPVQHGAALGLGLAAMGLAREDVHTELKNVLFSDSAVAGEACGIALGLNMLGTLNEEALETMIAYAVDTQHEKIIRGLAVGVSLILYGRREQADAHIDRLVGDKDPILRTSACHSMAMAYAGTNNNNIIRRLLHIAVTDANDDVRRAAATALGFVLIRTPEQLPSVVALLCESFNPHVRAGCCMALGIACAATGNKQAIELVEPMIKDSVRYVRQAALIAMALILMQQPNSSAKATSFRKSLPEIIANKHEVVLVRFGAILAQGILEAGGRNVTVQACRDHGHMDAPTIVGLLVFTQFWFWYPFTHFLSMALTPTALICLNGDMQMPRIDVKSNAPPSRFAYPTATAQPKEKNKEKVATAILSISNKKNTRRKLGSLSEMDLKADEETAKKEKEEKEKKEKEAEEEKKEPEPEFELLSNPTRVVKDQLPLISIPKECRYKPVSRIHGPIVVLRDTTPGEEEELITIAAAGADDKSGTGSGADSDEPSMPPAFDFNVELEDEN